MPDPVLVLHVEDDERLAANVAALLRAQGYEALTAGDGAAALAQLAHARRSDVLIIDVNLPGDMDGADVAQEACRLLGRLILARGRR